ncbi:GNS1/SUR4 family domain-containing protein [Ditylenchus destructor]|uniref:Elongation of very long chain fatty acids protein n=1 Tax=Ditylenchus destructor TaxID=166010 RepID=A0AAD4NIR0_9BILA|nr:GNS1/SUR4 family domain-containing protein [Ditylenchus destructor]
MGSPQVPHHQNQSLKADITSVTFDHKEFFRILTSESFPEDDAKRWIDNHFYLTFQISTLYVFVIFGTKYLMRDRQPFNLRVPLNAWNLFLAVFSIMGVVRLSPEFFTTLFNDGFQNSYCHVTTFTSGLNGYWVWLFIVSKMFELVDTVFIVLRKRPLLFLHWYHHILTMIYAFYSYPLSPGFNRWGIYLNYFVHAFMYSYYFLCSMKIKVPGAIAKFITTIQIWQFVISVVILIHLGFLISNKTIQCDFDPRVFTLAVLMDVSYLVLFINFFVKAYVLRGGKAKYRKGEAVEKNGKAQANGSIANGKAHTNGTANGVCNGSTEHLVKG